MSAVCRSSRRGPAGLLLALAAWASSPGVWGADLGRARLMALAGSVLKVEAIRESGGYSIGTGVSVAPGKFVTNCHVTHDAESIMLVRGGARWAAVAELADPFLDLCVLDVPDLREVPAIPLGSAGNLKLGQAVAAMGFTGGAGMQLRAGVVSGLHDLNGSKVIQTTTAFTSGASGGALFNQEGQVVGILTFRLRGADGYYFSTPVDWIAARIADPRGYAKIAPLHGAKAFWAQPIEALPYFMQAASLEAGGKWDELLKLTEKWSGAEDRNAEPWFLRGNSYAKLNRVEGAVKAYRRAVVLNPDFGQAWFNLGAAYARLGEPDEVARVLTVLRELDSNLADELAVTSAGSRR